MVLLPGFDAYKTHKVVGAMHIAFIMHRQGSNGSGYVIADGAGNEWAMSDEFSEHHNPKQGGYIVQYADGYMSYSPKEAFEAGYTPQQDGFHAGDAEGEGWVNLNFSVALQFLKAGKAMTRAGWNGKGQFVVLMPALRLPPHNSQGVSAKVNDRTAKWIGEDAELDCQPYFAIYTAQGKWQPGWLASQSDMMADDWELV